MTRQIIIGAAVAGVVLGCFPAPAFPSSLAAEHPVINNLAAEVFLYWERVKNLSPEEKYKAWMETIESKHADFYENVIYGGLGGRADEATKRAMVEKFLAALPDSIDRLRACAASMEKEIREIHQLLRQSFPGYPAGPEYYLAISLGTSDGGVRPLNHRFICFFGVDVASEIKTEVRRRALITHESFHLYQLSWLMPKIMSKYGATSMPELISKMGVGPMMFIEGQAVRATEKVYPQAGLYAVYEKLIPDIQKKMPQLVDGLIAGKDAMSLEIYKKYFLDPNEDSFVPEKSAYYLGYLIVKRLEKETPLEKMFEWDLETLKQKMIDGLVWLEREGKSSGSS